LELGDRFGRVPSEVEALLEVQAVRLLCRKVGIERVGMLNGVIEAEFAGGREPKPSQMKRLLRECDHPLEFDSRRGFVVRFKAPRDRRSALSLGRKVLKHFAACASVS